MSQSKCKKKCKHNRLILSDTREPDTIKLPIIAVYLLGSMSKTSGLQQASD